MNTPAIIEIYKFHDFTIDVGSRTFRSPSGKILKLSSRAFDVLLELIRQRGKVVSKEHLLETIWPNLYVEENNINQAIRLLRKALGDSNSDSVFIQTVQGRGYCLVADVIVVDDLDFSLESNRGDSSEKGVSGTGKDADIKTERHSAPGGSFLTSGAISHSSWQRGLNYSGIVLLVILVITGLFFFDDIRSVSETQYPVSVASGNSNSTDSLPVEEPVPDSLAVMPLTMLNNGSDGELFASGLHDELVNQLVKISSLKVISRDSVLSIAEDGRPVSEIASLLKVESVMTGTFLFADDQARISLQILNAKSGIMLWAESYEVNTQDLADMVSVQNRIAHSVVKALEVQIRPQESAMITSMPTQSYEAYRYFMTARHSYPHQENKGKWLLVKKAIELDPDFPEAQLMFASINSIFVPNPMLGISSEEHLRYMFTSVEEYIRLKPDRSEGYALKAVALAIRHDWEGVQEQISILDELGASLADQKYLALLYMIFGNFQQAINFYEESLITEPANLYSRGLLMAAYEMSGNRAVARREYDVGNELKSAWWGDSVNLLLAMGRNEPLVGLEEVVDLSPDLIFLMSQLNDTELVSHGVQEFINSSSRNASDGIYYSALAAYTGDIQSAVALMRMTVADVSTSIFWAWLPVFSEVRQTQEFREMLVDFGLVSYWQKYGWPAICHPVEDSFVCN